MDAGGFPAEPARVGVLFTIGMAALIASLVLASGAALAAVFDDGNDRKSIRALRDKPAGQLADAEKAMLVAANRIGSFSLCDGEIGGSAFLVRYEGRSAIVTNAHLFMKGDGSPAGCAGRMEDGASYMPNLAWIDSGPDDGFALREVRLVFPPANWDDLRALFRFTAQEAVSEHDVAVFYLREDISSDEMPDGHRRGVLRATYTADIGDRLYMLGHASDVGNGSTMIYQQRCPGGRLKGRWIVGHACDVMEGSSGSLLAIMEDGELRFRGIQSSGWIATLSTVDAVDADMLNHATSSSRLGHLGGLD